MSPKRWLSNDLQRKTPKRAWKMTVLAVKLVKNPNRRSRNELYNERYEIYKFLFQKPTQPIGALKITQGQPEMSYLSNVPSNKSSQWHNLVQWTRNTVRLREKKPNLHSHPTIPVLAGAHFPNIQKTKPKKTFRCIDPFSPAVMIPKLLALAALVRYGLCDGDYVTDHVKFVTVTEKLNEDLQLQSCKDCDRLLFWSTTHWRDAFLAYLQSTSFLADRQDFEAESICTVGTQKGYCVTSSQCKRRNGINLDKISIFQSSCFAHHVCCQRK